MGNKVPIEEQRENKTILNIFKESHLVRENISRYSLLILSNFLLLILCAVFEVFGVGMLVPIIESVEGSDQSSFFVKFAKDLFDYFSIEYSAINLLIVFGTLIVTRFGLLIYQQHLARVLSSSITKDLRAASTDNLLTSDLTYFSRKNIGEIVSTIFVSSQNSGGLLEYFMLMLRGIIFCAAYIVVALILSAEYTLMVAVFIGISYFFVLPRFKKSEEYGGIEKDLMDETFDELQDKFSGVRVIKIFNQENRTYQEIKKLVTDFKINDIRLMDNKLISFAFFEPFLFMMMVISIIFSISFLNLPVANLLVSLLVFTLLIPQFKLVNGNILQIKQLIPHFKKVNELIEEKPRVKEGRLHCDGFDEKIRLSSIKFKYQSDSEFVLNDIDLTIPKNSFLAIIGPSGSGKSTLADIILRNYDPTQGEIFIDDLLLSDILISDWRAISSMVDQDCYLFNDTVKNNIKYGKPSATDQEVIEAAEAANAHEFITNLKNGYNTSVGNRGAGLSGGERQRIALARALILKPDILILDEATSALDSASEELFKQTMDDIRGETTLIVIAHRLSTIRDAESIIFLEDGKIIEQGNHNELILENKRYKKFIELQSRLGEQD